MREPEIKSTYKDAARDITFEVMYYLPLDQTQINQFLDEYYRRYDAPVPKDGSTVRIICDACGPRPPIPAE